MYGRLRFGFDWVDSKAHRLADSRYPLEEGQEPGDRRPNRPIENIQTDAKLIASHGQNEDDPDQNQQAVRLQPRQRLCQTLGNRPTATRPPSSGGNGSMLKMASTRFRRIEL